MEFSVCPTDEFIRLLSAKVYNQCFPSTESQSPSKERQKDKDELKTYLWLRKKRELPSLPHSLVLGCTEDI